MIVDIVVITRQDLLLAFICSSVVRFSLAYILVGSNKFKIKKNKRNFFILSQLILCKLFIDYTFFG